MLRRRLVMCATAGILLFGGLEAASADSILTGQTSQQLAVRVGLAANGGIEHLKFFWRARCSRGVPTLQNKTIARVVNPEPAAFFGTGHYVLSRGGNTYRIRARTDASPGTTLEDQAANQVRWNGTFKVRATVRRDGKAIAKCRRNQSSTAVGPPPVVG